MRVDKEAATLEFRELTRIYHVALSMVGSRPQPQPVPRPPPPPPKPPPPPDAPIEELVTFWIDDWEMSVFGGIYRDVRISPQLLMYGGKLLIKVKMKNQHPDDIFAIFVPSNTRNGQKFRLCRPNGDIEIMLVSER
jgi:hypothetical protein